MSIQGLGGGWFPDVGAPAGTITGGGTAFHLAMFTGATTIGDSIAEQVGGNIGIGTVGVVAEKLIVDGNIAPLTTGTNSIGTAALRYSGIFLSSAIDYTSNLKFNVSSVQKLLLDTTGNMFFNSGNGIDVVASGGVDVLNIGTTNADTINIGWSGATVNIIGTVLYENVTNLQVSDKLFTINKGGAAASGGSTGMELEEGGGITGWVMTNAARTGWDLKAPATFQSTYLLSSLTADRIHTLPDSSVVLLGGTGTTNRVPKYSATVGVLADSNIEDTGLIINFLSNTDYSTTYRAIFGTNYLTKSSSANGLEINVASAVATWTFGWNNGQIRASGNLDDPSIWMLSSGANTRISYGNATDTRYWRAGKVADDYLIDGILNADATATPVFKIFNTNGDFTIGAGSAVSGITSTITIQNKVVLDQQVATTGSPSALVLNAAAHTTLAASTEAIDVNYNLARIVQFGTGALATQRAFVIQAPTYAFVGASTITTAATLAITGPPIAGAFATIANPVALWIQTGGVQIGGTVPLSGEFVAVQRSVNSGLLVRIWNPTSGTAASAALAVSNNASQSVQVSSFSAGYTSAGIFAAATGVISSNVVNGFNIGCFNSAPFSFWTNNTQRMAISATGDISINNKGINAVTGDSATINATIGRFRKDTSGTTFTLTNSFITANSIIILTLASAPAAGSFGYYVTAGAGSATIEFEAAPAADMDVNFMVFN